MAVPDNPTLMRPVLALAGDGEEWTVAQIREAIIAQFGLTQVAATTLEKSLKWAGVLDNSNNILPARPGGTGEGPHDPANQQRQNDGDNGRSGGDDDTRSDVLSLEIPVGEDRKVLVKYPRDLTSAEAKKVGNVLNALVS